MTTIITTLIITSPVEQFEVSPLLYLTGPLVNDLVFALTNVVVYASLVSFLAVGFHLITDNGLRLVPTYWSSVTETLYASTHAFSSDQLSTRHMVYFPFLYSLFITLLVSNLVGNIPYGYTLTSTAVISIGISVTVFTGVTIIGLIIHRLHWFAYFVPAGTPLPLVPMLVLIEVLAAF